MGIIGEIRPERIFEYIRLDNIPNTAESYLMFFVMTFIIGAVVLTWRYVINPVTKDEYEKWKNETIITKSTLCLIVGLIAYIGTFSIVNLFDAIFLLLIKQEVFSLRFFDIGGMVISMIYGFSFLYVLSKKKISAFKDIQMFFIINFFMIPILAPITIFFILLPESLTLAIFSFFMLIPLLIIILPLIVFLVKNKKRK